jgi:hypothetical protein
MIQTIRKRKHKVEMNRYGSPWEIRECPKTLAIDTSHGPIMHISDDLKEYADLIRSAPEILEALEVIETIASPPHHENALESILGIARRAIGSASSNF